MIRVRSPSRVTSPACTIAFPPARSTAPATRFSPSSSRAASTSVAPRLAHARARDSPIPLDAPVTTTVRGSADIGPAQPTRRYWALSSFWTISAVTRSVARLLLSIVSNTP